MIPNPAIALGVFFGLIALVYLIYTLVSIPRILNSRKEREKVILEDILKQLYHAENSGRKAGINDLAGAIKLKPDRIVQLIESATQQGFIVSREGALTLTDTGNSYALKIIRTHRLWEKYLSEKTGVQKLDWHPSAEVMEHKLSEEQVASIDSELGNPRFDPHGDPIPTEKGEMRQENWIPMSSLDAGSIAKVVHIEDEPVVIYKQIIDKKVHIDSQIKILSSDDQEVSFYSEGNSYSFSTLVAGNISVMELQKDLYDPNAHRLSELVTGEKGTILGISSECRGASRRRLLDLGFIRGTEISPEFDSPMLNPRAYMIRNTLIALRKSQAEHILIEKT